MAIELEATSYSSYNKTYNHQHWTEQPGTEINTEQMNEELTRKQWLIRSVINGLYTRAIFCTTWPGQNASFSRAMACRGPLSRIVAWSWDNRGILTWQTGYQRCYIDILLQQTVPPNWLTSSVMLLSIEEVRDIILRGVVKLLL